MTETSQIPRSDLGIRSHSGAVAIMALLFAACAFLLVWNIRSFLLGSLSSGVPRRLDAIGYTVVALYGFLFAYSFPGKSLKVAFLFLGANYARLAVGYFYTPAVQNHLAAVIASIAMQIAFLVFLFAIARWFKSTRLTQTQDGGS